jgi:large subunit ribosomal protein L9
MSSVKLILLEDVENLGLAGDEVNVAAGYARNYLIPRKLASKASPGALRQLDARKERIVKQREDELATAKMLAEKLAETEVSISMQAGEDDHLYGSVGPRNIADKLAEQGIEIDHNRIKLDDNIKELGLFNVDVHLHPEVDTTLKVWIVRA